MLGVFYQLERKTHSSLFSVDGFYAPIDKNEKPSRGQG